MTNSYKGKLLISTPDTMGDIFSRSVVLIIEHNDEGAFGLILNKKHKRIAAKLEYISPLEINIYEGGPMESDKLFFIIKGEPITPYFTRINEKFYMSEDIETIFTSLIEQSIKMEDVKIFAGYSGWSPGQLESEVKNKYWTLIEDSYQLDYVAKTDTNLWRTMMQNLGGEYLLWANTPADVHWN